MGKITKNTSSASEKNIVVIAGATASGKTGASIELAKKLDIEVISADSRQIYKYLNVGTATPSEEELAAVKTWFVNIIEPDEYYSAGKFGDEAEAKALNIISLGRLPVVVGGSGLYIKALCEGFFDEAKLPKARKEVRRDLNAQMKDKGADYLYEKLKEVDLESAEKYRDKNPRRILRALEYYYATGDKLSTAQKKHNKKRIVKPIYFGIKFEREILYDRINRRAEKMWKRGLIEETKRVLDMGFSPDLNSLNTVGYKEAIAYLNGKMSETEALESMKKNTRRYAKRQMTWFKKVEGMRWLEGDNEQIAEQILKNLKQRFD